MVHSKYLEILDSNIKRNQRELDLLEVLPYKKNEFLVFRTRDNVPPGNYTINIGMVIIFILVLFRMVLFEFYENGHGTIFSTI